MVMWRLLQGLNLGAVNAEVDRRGFIPVNERMQVIDKSGKALPSVYCIGDANGESSCNSILLNRQECGTTASRTDTLPSKHVPASQWAACDLFSSQTAELRCSLALLSARCMCREVHAGSCCKRTRHQRSGKHLQAASCAEPQFCASGMLHSPRGQQKLNNKQY